MEVFCGTVSIIRVAQIVRLRAVQFPSRAIFDMNPADRPTGGIPFRAG